METENPIPDSSLCTDTKISEDLFALLEISNDMKDEENESVHNQGDEEEAEDDEEEEDDDNDEFSFMCGGAITSPIAAEDAFINGQIKPVFPLFNRDLFFSGEDSDGLLEKLPMRPPVMKVFVETSGVNGQASQEGEQFAGIHCEWSDRKAVEASPEVCRKSNSTGFSKIWRFKDLLGRSNSDGRDAFVFLNNGHAPPPTADIPAPVKVEKESPVNAKGKVKKGKRTTPLSSHEVYLKSKAKGEERRRSYLPYRPELMGFFTNVNGGLSKNVHPF